MLNVITVLKSGGVYTKEYIINLRTGVRKHLKQDHRFICLTDTVGGETVFDDENYIQWEPLRHDWPAHYSKVEIFRPDLEKYGKFLFIDASCLIVGDLTDIATLDKEICVTEDFYYGGPSQSILLYEPGSLRGVWDKFTADPDKWMAEGEKMIAPKFHDQVLMYDMKLPYWQTELPGQVVSYKVHCQNGMPPGARIIKFHGTPRIHELPAPWVEPAWREGLEPAITEGTTENLNTPISKILDQVVENAKRDLPWIARETRRGDVVIVGGGPSLPKDINRIRSRQKRGQHIWAVNGTHDFLIERNIIPDAMVMMDARPDNAVFVQHPRDDVTYYIASRCHPDVFDALEGYNVVVWHSVDPGYQDAVNRVNDGRVWEFTGGGNTVALRAMYLAVFALGFDRVHLYGVDSSYAEGEHHAYEQKLNDDRPVQKVIAGNKVFWATPEQVLQVKAFQEQAEALGKAGKGLTVHGDGLLPYVATLMKGSSLEQPQSNVLPEHRERQAV